MELLFDRPPQKPPELTFVLLDWDCRESYHFLDYLAKQTVDRDRYEVMWVEYYTKRAPELRERIDKALAAGTPPPIDRYVVLDLPKRVCYHKHLMGNVGIALARGGIVCGLDSDAMARPTLVASILDCFQGGANIVLHLDELRSVERRFYPFNFPSFDEVEGTQAINSVQGVPAGLLDRKDMLHSRNYGACMAARRSDLIAVGGADMHWDYLGYICGPYDLTFRLLNAGARIKWHASEWILLTPGTPVRRATKTTGAPTTAATWLAPPWNRDAPAASCHSSSIRS